MDSRSSCSTPVACRAPDEARRRSSPAGPADYRRVEPFATQPTAKINARTAQLQNELWAAIGPAATAHPTPVMALVLNGMNDVLNSQGYAQAAWWNRIPPAAWLLMLVIAMGCCVSVGYGARNFRRERWLLLSVPFIVATSFFSIADIDSPRNGVIRVVPLNLHSLVDSLAPKN